MHCCTFRRRDQEYLVCEGSKMWFVCTHGVQEIVPGQLYERRCKCEHFEIYKAKPTWL